MKCSTYGYLLCLGRHKMVAKNISPPPPITFSSTFA
nr:MAG TPA: hypothetical protein [Caudoviricetes sp.]